MSRIGVIGGTGLYGLENVSVEKKVFPKTPWGRPSDEILLANYKTRDGGSIPLAFLPRHGRGHFILPSELPQKANLASLKMLGVEHILSFSAVGSLKEEIEPTHFVLPAQIIDRTRHRPESFYGDGIVVHISFGEPFSSKLSQVLEESIREVGITLHINETLICMEGPAFSTRAESRLYRSWGAGIINMSVLPEAKLARELEMSYQMICMSTDYDSWRESTEAVTASEIMKVVTQNSQKANLVLQNVLEKLRPLSEQRSEWHGSISQSIITARERIPKNTRKRLSRVLPDIF